MKLKLSKQLFWDTNLRDIDEKKHADFIIGRVLQYGDVPDFKKIMQYYRLARVRLAAQRVSFLDVQSAFLWANVLALPELKKRVCTPRSSVIKLFRPSAR